MATFTKKMSGDDRYSIKLTVTETSYSITNNTSTISYSLTATKSSGTGYYTSNTNNPYKITINNVVEKDDSRAYDFTGSTPKTITLASGTKTIAHDEDGTKTIAVSGYFKDANNSLGKATASGSVKLTDIPRASAISAPNPIYLNEATTISLTRYSNDYINDLYYSFGTHTDVQFATGVTDSATLTLPNELLEDIPTSDKGTLEIKCMTYNQDDNSYIGTSTITTIATIHTWNTVYKPNLTYSSPTVSNTSDYPANWGVFIKGKCKADFTITATAKYGASIISYETILEGYSYTTTSITTNTLMNAGSHYINTKAIDSRGLISQITAPYITVLDYNNPTLGTMEIQRCDVNGNLDRNGNYALVTFAGSITSCNNKNTPYAVYKIGYKVHGTDTYTYIPCGTNADTYSQSGMLYTDGIYPANRGSGTKQQLPSTNTYDIQFFAGDYFTSTTSEQQLDTGFDLLNFNTSGKSMAIGKVSEAGADESLLEIALPTQISEDVTMVDGAKIVGYQPKLTAGTNITIDANNVISASGGGGGTATDVQINGTTITSNNVANILTQSTYNASTNKIATKNDIPTLTSQLTNNSGYITNSVSNLTNYTKTSDLSSVATSGSYSDLSNKPTIPTVNNGTLTIQKNGTNVQTFTANQSSNVTANITVPTKTSDLTNDSNFITDVSNKTDTSVLPNDNGEIKTKFRISNKGYTGSGNPNWYYKLCELPTDNNGNYASAIISGRIGGWVNDNMSSISALAWNRNGTGISLLDIAGGATAMSSIWGRCDIVIYTDANPVSTTAVDNGKDIIYLKCSGYYTFDLDVELFQSTATFLYDGTYLTTTPTGTLVAQASTSNKRVEIINSKLYVAGNEMGKKSDIPTNTNQLTNGAGFITSGAIQDDLEFLTTITSDNKNIVKSAYKHSDNKSTYISSESIMHDNSSGTYTPINDVLDNKQDKLVSGTNIKTINGYSILGSGNLPISGGGGTATDVQVNGTSITSGGVANIRTNGTYNASSNKIATMSDLPTVNNATLTIQKNGTTVKTFSANASSNVTANITVPTNTNELTNGAGFITSSYHDSSKQDKLVSGTNIKTINNTSLLSSGNMTLLTEDDIYYKTGDIIELGDTAAPGLYVANGYITSSTKKVNMTFIVPKRLDNISSITVNSLNVESRGISGYLNSQSGYVEYVNKSGYTITAWVSSSNSISVTIEKSSAYTNISNNTLVSIDGYIKFTLS